MSVVHSEGVVRRPLFPYHASAPQETPFVSTYSFSPPQFILLAAYVFTGDDIGVACNCRCFVPFSSLRNELTLSHFIRRNVQRNTAWKYRERNDCDGATLVAFGCFFKKHHISSQKSSGSTSSCENEYRSIFRLTYIEYMKCIRSCWLYSKVRKIKIPFNYFHKIRSWRTPLIYKPKWYRYTNEPQEKKIIIYCPAELSINPSKQNAKTQLSTVLQ